MIIVCFTDADVMSRREDYRKKNKKINKQVHSKNSIYTELCWFTRGTFFIQKKYIFNAAKYY